MPWRSCWACDDAGTMDFLQSLKALWSALLALAHLVASLLNLLP
ncbi:hypothetical protein E5CHR_00064 [Variovorax sp. PBL-E5]|nr:hypothetical protein SRS16CHR_00055 [Variovorax sp. SRS16]VTU16163.1 hypothetical protein E5CHR_00064 [Variovorax sp. PBL-E5]